MFAISGFQYIILAFVFSKGAPYRCPIWSNIPFCFALVLIVPESMDFRYWMLGYGVVNFLIHIMVETVIVEYMLFKKFQARRDHDLRTSKRRYMQIEYEMQFYRNWPQITEEIETYDNKQMEQDSNPTYFEISAEQNFDTPTFGRTPLNSFFDADSAQATTTVVTGAQTIP
ncbi:hypothetical protein GQX74_013293 [Glossina fuscipes]|nr:hypothetical protein GQX74_013293 [Glossina fuscipes]